MNDKIHKINDKWGFSVDSYGNYSPHKWRESSEIKIGVYKGQMSKAKWVHQEKFMKNEVAVLRWIIEQEKSEINPCSIEEYIVQFEQLNAKYLGGK